MGSKIMNYAFLFSNTQGKMKSPVNSIQLSKLGTKSVQTQLRAAGIDTNSKQYKTVISQMMKNGNGMMYTNPHMELLPPSFGWSPSLKREALGIVQAPS